MNPNPLTFDVPTGLSNLLSSYDDAHWETVVVELKANSGVLKCGSVLSAVGGKLELTTSGNQATAFGVLLDEAVDTTVPYSDGSVTASVARAGSFRAPALIVSAGVDSVALAEKLRDIGICVHGGIIAPAQAARQQNHPQQTKRPQRPSKVSRQRAIDFARRAFIRLPRAVSIIATIVAMCSPPRRALERFLGRL